MEQTSFWYNSSPKDTECFTAMCTHTISEGEICVGHFHTHDSPSEDINAAYGLSCAQCGMKYAKEWKCGPLPAQWDENGWGIVTTVNNKHPNFTPQSQCPTCKTLHRWPPKQHYYCEVCEGSLELVDIEAGTPIPPVSPVEYITYISFSYKWGVPTTASRIFDVRQKVRNPWRDPTLRKLNGLHPDVQSFVLQCRGAQNVLKRCLPHYTPLGPYIIGCQGGKHRSVALVELAAAQARERGWDVTVIHRDLDRKKEENGPTKP